MTSDVEQDSSENSSANETKKLEEETPAEEQEVKELANGNCDIKAPVDEISEVQTEESLDDAVEHSTGVSAAEYSEQEPAVCADEKAEEPTAVEKNEELINEPKHDDNEIINSDNAVAEGGTNESCLLDETKDELELDYEPLEEENHPGALKETNDPAEERRCLQFSEIDPSLKAERLTELVAPFGKVDSVQIVESTHSKKFFGMVVCESATMANSAKDALDGVEVDGNKLTVGIVKSDVPEENGEKLESNKEDTDKVKLKDMKEKNEIQRKKTRYLRDAVYDSRAKMRRLKEDKKRQENDKAYYEKSEKRQRGEYLDEKIKLKKLRNEYENLKREKDPVLLDRQRSKKELEKAKMELDCEKKELAVSKKNIREIRDKIKALEEKAKKSSRENSEREKLERERKQLEEEKQRYAREKEILNAERQSYNSKISQRDSRSNDSSRTPYKSRQDDSRRDSRRDVSSVGPARDAFKAPDSRSHPYQRRSSRDASFSDSRSARTENPTNSRIRNSSDNYENREPPLRSSESRSTRPSWASGYNQGSR
ncbi:unnamed protein product [Oikopleura dioica]|uniref:RRM domain-containing protein n=1 Tax=Oikopleura dioica TaxID=34765 RepID=E4YTF4_OIKDI|nr:unnamed protein product [Oikopleura dioica]